MSTKTVKGLSVATYDKMIEKGVLPETNRLELIEGRIVEKMGKSRPHCVASERTWRRIGAFLPADWHVRIEKPVRIPDRKSEPEPDVSVARGGPDDYLPRHPGPGDVALVVEISVTSAVKDRKLARVYAAGGVSSYWIVDLAGRRLEIYGDPDQGVYRSHAVMTDAESVELAIGGQALGMIAVADLLPPAS